MIDEVIFSRLRNHQIEYCAGARASRDDHAAFGRDGDRARELAAQAIGLGPHLHLSVVEARDAFVRHERERDAVESVRLDLAGRERILLATRKAT